MAKIKPYTAIPLPEVIDPDGLDRLLIFIFPSGTEYEHLRRRYRSREGILQLFSRLDDREPTLIILRFGLGGQGPLTVREVGARLNLSETRVRRLQSRAGARMRRPPFTAKRGRTTLSPLVLEPGDKLTFNAGGDLIVIHTDESITNLDAIRGKRAESTAHLSIQERYRFQLLCSVVAATHGLLAAEVSYSGNTPSCTLVESTS